jgi:hypothetical protein
MLAVAGVMLAAVPRAMSATWDPTTIYTGSQTMRDVAVGTKLKSASDAAVYVVAGEYTTSGSTYNLWLATDISTSPPMSWSTTSIATSTVPIMVVAIGNINSSASSGYNSIVFGTYLPSGTGTVGLYKVSWSGSAWVKSTIVEFTSVTGPIGINCLAVGDGDGDATRNEVVYGYSTEIHISWYTGMTT